MSNIPQTHRRFRTRILEKIQKSAEEIVAASEEKKQREREKLIWNTDRLRKTGGFR